MKALELKGTDSYADKSYIKIRCDGGTLVQIAMGAGLKRFRGRRSRGFISPGDAISITFNGTKNYKAEKHFMISVL